MARLTKEEKERIENAKRVLMNSKEKVFKDIGDEAHREFLDFCPCKHMAEKTVVTKDENGNEVEKTVRFQDYCPFLSSKCHKACGVVMKHLWKNGTLTTGESFGNTNRVVTAAESEDTTGYVPGLSEAVDEYELSHNDTAESNEINESELEDYD